MRIACSFDHAGFPLKQIVLEVVREAGHEPIDLGTNSTDPVDYPDTARAAARASAPPARTTRTPGASASSMTT
jgi:ribose 5-phosphate isomerase B